MNAESVQYNNPGRCPGLVYFTPLAIIGDSFMVIFRTALDALDFVLALERETGDARIIIRAGIHVGSARIFDDDIFGNMVNYTKRVEGVQVDAASRLAMLQKGKSQTRKQRGTLGRVSIFAS